jgi:hypothetical protein
LAQSPNGAVAIANAGSISSTAPHGLSRLGIGLPAGVHLTPEMITLAKSMLGSKLTSFSGRSGGSGDQGVSQPWGSGQMGAAWKTWRAWSDMYGSSNSASNGNGSTASNGSTPSAVQGNLTTEERVGIPTVPTALQQSGLSPAGSSQEEDLPQN